MHGVLSNANLARIPGGALNLLGRLRAYASLQVRIERGFVWVRWDEAGHEILRTLLPVKGVRFYERMDSHWHLCGHSLPAFDIPEDGFVPLATALVPGPQHTISDVEEPSPRVALALTRSATVQPAAALLCGMKALVEWVEMAPTRVIEGIQAARSENRVLLMGQHLPVITGERFWGERLLCPLGWAPDPALPESALLEAIGVREDELALMRGAEVELIPREAFRTLTRASARLVVA